jgi:Polyketide cyclase / dehydrase and lipid transport
MKFLKRLGITIGVIVALMLIIPLFTKDEYSVVREVTVDRPKEDVFSYIKLLKNQDNFSVWANMDKSMKKSYSGTDGTVGFVSAWDSQDTQVGAGAQEIKKILPGERIDYELRFLKPMKATNQAYMKVESVSDKQTKVSWGFQAKTPYPFNLMLLFFDAEAMIGKAFAEGLGNLKKILEKK